MSVLKLSVLEKRPPLRFPKGNSIGFWQDRSYWRGIPSDRDFFIIEEASQHDAYYLGARDYGVEGDYGNGSIAVQKIDIVRCFIPAIAAFPLAKADA